MKKFGLFLLAALTVIIPVLASVASAAPSFADPNFQKVWERTDKILTERTNVGRGFIWGPASIYTGNENYADAPGGQRLVQYFDKARMEVNNPSGDRNDPNFITSGLLVKELVLGRQQNANDVNNFTQGNPSEVQVAGDPNTGGSNAVAPTYRTFKNLATFNQDNPVTQKSGQNINQQISKDGTITTFNPPEQRSYTAYLNLHNVADVFIAYGNLQGLIWNGSGYANDQLFFPSATAIFGLPITDPYWTRAVVAGVEKDVLVQLFERRTLTYTPSNDANSKVEMGNVGQHYYRWRYQENLGRGTGTPTPTTPPPPPTPSNDYSQFRAPYLKSGNIPQGGVSANIASYPTGASAINSSPVYDPDKKLAIIGTTNGGVVAVNLNNFSIPTQAWKYPNPATAVAFDSPVVLFNGTVYIGGSDGKVYAIKEADGTEVWKSSAAGGAVNSQIALDVDSAYFTAADGKLYAINLSNGTPKWQANIAGANLINSPVIGSDGTLYVTASDNKVYAFKKDGTQVAAANWNPPTLDTPAGATPAFANNKLYVGTTNGTLYALNLNGTVQTFKTFTAGKGILSTPAFYNGRVYVGTDDGNVYGVDANNVATVQWTFTVGGTTTIRSSVAAVDGFIYFAASNKNVYRVEAGNQSNVATLATAGAAFGTNSPVVNSGYLVIASPDGFLHTIK